MTAYLSMGVTGTQVLQEEICPDNCNLRECQWQLKIRTPGGRKV